MKPKLTPRQRMFVEAYAGNATEAAKAAGYSEKTAATAGSRLYRNVQIRAAIQRREDRKTGRLIKSRTEVQAFWSERMDDDSEKTVDRLRASELLEKSRGGFSEKVEVNHTGDVNIRVIDPYAEEPKQE